MGIEPRPDISIRSILSWGVLNLGLLGLGAAAVPVWAHHSFPRESLSFYELVFGQMLLGSMLFPMLAQTRWTLAVNLALLLPFDELAGLLSNLDQIGIFRCYSFVAIWLIGLGLWRGLLKNDRSQLAVIAIATCMTAGGAVLDYLRWEAASVGGTSESFRPVSPLPCLYGLALHFNPKGWIETSIPAILGIIWFTASRIPKSPSTSLHKAA